MAGDGSKKSKVSSTAPPRKINVQKFAETRASELESLHSIVSNRLNNNFRSQRNKRRRTTAYDNQAAKKRHRKRRNLGLPGKANDDLASGSENKEPRKVPRRVRRRIELKKNTEFGFAASGDGTRRLRTHVWHAKRFTMTKLWGFHLPLGLHGRGRGSRALLKWYRDGAVVHDASYHTAVQLEGPEESLISILNMVLVPSPSAQSRDIAESILTGVIYGTAMLHHAGAPVSQPIAPVNYMWRPSCLRNRENGNTEHSSGGCNETQISDACSSHRQLWVWIHASAFSEGYDALKFACQKQMNESGILINCLSLEGQLAKLEVMGSKASELLQKTLHPFSCNSDNSWQLRNCSDFRILSLAVKDPRSLPVNIADIPKPTPTSVLNNFPEDEANEHDASIVNFGNGEKDPHPLHSEPERSNRAPDNRNLWDASSRVTPPLEENVLCWERHHLHLDFIHLDGRKSRTPNASTKVEGSTSCPILLLKNSNGLDSLMGWSVILPLSWVRVFWIPFVSKGAHAIGLREKRWIACEVGMPQFPSDFPDCNAHLSFMVNEGAALEHKVEQLPPSVRPLKVPMPLLWNSVRLTLDKGSTIVQDPQISGRKDNIDDNSLLSSENGDCAITVATGHCNSFDGFVGRTSSILIDFLSEINADHLLLFPHIPNKKTRLLELMKDESILRKGQCSVHQITSNRRLCFIRVLLHAYKEGFIEEGAVVCALGPSDLSLWISRSENNEGGLQISQSSVGSYFKEQSPSKWELWIPQDPVVRESHRWPIGFVTTGFVRGSKKLVAEAFCEAVLLAQLREEQWSGMPVKQRRKEIYVLVRNLRSSAYRLALATVVLEQEEEDVLFL
ncbi:hypothetical protein OIU78_011297 [Salix suchowensis]|nr:hypothetical protein OIU78_011297 [Salix suchowensis]